MRKIAFLLLLFVLWNLNSQQKIPFINATEIFERTTQLSSESKYEEAIKLLHSVNKNDSLYLESLIKKTYYLVQLKKYEDVTKTADSGIALAGKNPALANLFNNKVVGHMNLKEFDKALESVNTALEIYPVNYLLNFNKALIHENLGNVKEALTFYQKAISYNPLNASSHLRMGNLCYHQGLFAQALMCFNTYLLINPDGNDSKSILTSLNNNVKRKYPDKKNPELNFSVDDSNYESIDLVLNGHIALNKDYEVDNEIDLALTKQNHALLVQLKDFDETDDFWGKRYVPLYKWIMNNNHFDHFIYTINYSSENERHKKVVSKNMNGIKSFLASFRKKWYGLVSPNKILIDGKLTQVSYAYNDNGLLSYFANIDTDNETNFYTFFYDYGNVRATGFYDSKEQQAGNWKWFHEDGQLKETGTFKNGLLQGQSIVYYKNGKVKILSNLKDWKFDGEYKAYLQSGALSEKKTYKEGLLNGPYESYFSVGKELPEFRTTYENDSIKGSLQEFYTHGGLYQQSNYKNGLLSNSKSYYVNGTIWEELNYKNGQLEGDYKLYHDNKQVAQSGQALKNAYHGLWKTYYKNGVLESEFNYEKGKVNGPYKYYDTDGLPYYEMTYRKGEIIAYKYYDKSGKTLSEARKKGGEFFYEGYNTNGSILAKGLYDVKGGKSGQWEHYSSFGILSQKGNYENDQPVGKHYTYFTNGSIKIEQDFKEGLMDGYYAEYYLNGKIKQQGWNQNDQQCGEWRDYFIDGSVSSIYFFHKGVLHGELIQYAGNGKLLSSSQYEYGTLIRQVNFNEKGEVALEFDFNSLDQVETLETKYSNGNLKASGKFVNKVKHGSYQTFYPNGGLSSEDFYSNGLLQGKQKAYYPNGNPKYVYNYLNGNLHGEQLDYHENGNIEQEQEYVYGELNGLDISKYDNGIISHERNYTAGKLHGKYKFFNEEGKLQLIRFYDYGDLIGYSYHDRNGKELDMKPIHNGTGKIVTYYDNGKKAKEMEFFNGEFVNSYKSYYYTGELSELINFLDGEYHQKAVEYYKNGNIKRESSFVHGIHQGQEKEYFENGQLKKIETYKNGSKFGVSKEYSKKGKLLKELNYFSDEITSLKTF